MTNTIKIRNYDVLGSNGISEDEVRLFRTAIESSIDGTIKIEDYAVPGHCKVPRFQGVYLEDREYIIDHFDTLRGTRKECDFGPEGKYGVLSVFIPLMAYEVVRSFEEENVVEARVIIEDNSLIERIAVELAKNRAIERGLRELGQKELEASRK